MAGVGHTRKMIRRSSQLPVRFRRYLRYTERTRLRAVRRTTMQRRLTVSLVALQLVVACGYAVSAQDAKRPSYARSSASRETTVALAVARARAAAVAPADNPGDELTLRMTPRFVSAPGYLRSLIRVAPNAD